MSSNDGAGRENMNVDFGYDGQNQRSRGNRRSRGRGNYDRSGGYNRGNRDRRNGNWRDSHPHPPSVIQPPVIDVDDDIQFPSITGTRGTGRRSRNPDHAGRAPIPDSSSSVVPQNVFTRFPNPPTEGSFQQVRYSANYRPRARGYPNPQRGYQNNPRRGGRASAMGYFNNYQFEAFPTRPLMPYEYQREKPEIDCVQQVEYYFSDSNLLYDQYLRMQMDEQGFVLLETIHGFKRVSLLKLSFEEFVERLRQSQLLEISEDGTRIRVRVDYNRWVAFTQFVRDSRVINPGPAELQSLYMKFMHETYGPNASIPAHLMTPPPPPSQPTPRYRGPPGGYYHQNTFFNHSSYEQVYTTVPVFGFPPEHPGFVMNNPYPAAYPQPQAQEYNSEYAYQENTYYPNPDFQRSSEAVVYDPTTTQTEQQDELTDMVDSMKIDNKNPDTSPRSE